MSLRRFTPSSHGLRRALRSRARFAFSALSLALLTTLLMSSPATAIARGDKSGGGADEGFALFTQEAVARGLTYSIQSVPQSNGLYGFGVACIDLDRDGDDDIVAVGKLNGQVGVFENTGAAQFVNRSASNGILNLTQASAIAATDLDGDGLPELLFTQIGVAHAIYRNLGNFQFALSPLTQFLAPAGAAKAVSLADIDRDGDLDMYVANYRFNTGPLSLVGSQLFRNDGDALLDIAPSMNLNQPARTFLGVFTDVDDDGDPDLAVSNDRGHLPPLYAANQLWRNTGGAFANISAGSGADVACFSMGMACGDFDGSGTMDLLVTNIPSPDAPVFGVNPLMLGNGDGHFVRAEAKWDVQDFNVGWGALFVDLDDDGWLDLYVNHQGAMNSLWHNTGSPPAIEIPLAAGAPGSSGLWSYSTAHADLDRDGDQDLVVSGLGSTLLLYMNHEGDERASVRVRVQGIGLNRDAIGARFEALVQGRTLVREVQCGGVGYLGQNTFELHLGLGNAAEMTSATLRFSDGASRLLSKVGAGAWSVAHPQLLGDGDRNGTIDLVDRTACTACLGIGATAECARFDFNGDWIIDALDLPLFETRLVLRRSDVDGDGHVGASDLTSVLGAWGSTAQSSSDVNLDGIVDATDLTAILAHWD